MFFIFKSLNITAQITSSVHLEDDPPQFLRIVTLPELRCRRFFFVVKIIFHPNTLSKIHNI